MKEISSNTALNTKQNALLDLLFESDKIMSENGIEYALFGGSALGARRHQGFIPWDDDIDIILDFENYYKLEKLFQDGPVGRVNLVFFNNEPNWYRPFAMFVKTDDTCYAVPSLYTNGSATGTRIDVMICDYVPEERLEDYRRDLMLYEESLMDVSLTDYELYNYKEDYYRLKKRIKKEGKAKVEYELRKKLEAYSDLPHADQLTVRFWTRELRHYNRSDVFPAIPQLFEGYKFPVPAKAEKQLREQYGYDWYLVPPAEMWESHAFFDNDFISGRNYHEDLMQFIDQDIGEKAMIRIKRGRVESAPYVDTDNRFKKNLAAQRELMRFGIKDSNKYTIIRELFHDGRYSDICREFQGLRSVLGSIKAVDKEHKTIPADVLNAWLFSNVYCGRHYDVIKILSAFDESESNEVFAEVLELTARIKALVEAYQDDDVQLMRERLDSFSLEERNMIPDCILAVFKLQKTEGEIKENSKLLEACNSYLSKAPMNYDIIKVKGELLLSLAKTDEAMDAFKTVYENSNNGLDLLDLQERGINVR